MNSVCKQSSPSTAAISVMVKPFQSYILGIKMQCLKADVSFLIISDLECICVHNLKHMMPLGFFNIA